MRKYEGLWYLLLIAILLITIWISLMVGATLFSDEQLIAAFSGHATATFNTLIQIRVPRILATLICGGMLAVAGALSQASFHNKLADPSILGITGAGSLIISLSGFFIPPFFGSKFLYAFIGGALVLSFLSIRSILQNSYKLLIVGIALSLTFSGIQQLFSGEMSVNVNTFNGITWPDTMLLLIMGLVGLILALILSPWANYLKMSNQQLESRGVSPLLIRFCLLALVLYLSSGVTAEVGTIPFIGIIVPNVARYLVGRDYQTIIPFSMLMGAWLLLTADTVGRTIILPSEMPVATIMTVVGGPFLIVMLWRQKANEVS